MRLFAYMYIFTIDEQNFNIPINFSGRKERKAVSLPPVSDLQLFLVAAKLRNIKEFLEASGAG